MPPKPLQKPKAQFGKSKGKGKGKQNKQKRHKLNLKGWLKTAADWARFDAWAKVNALPRKIPDPEPIVRESRPLSQLKKRLEIISQPSPSPDPKSQCRLDLSVSKGALRARPSKRIRELAMFVWKEEIPGKIPNLITKAALKYVASPRIVEIAKPHLRDPEICRSLAVSKKALKHKTTKREKEMSIAKRARECPESLTEEEMAGLLTPGGIKKSALTYKISEWVSILALPSYRFLKDRNDPEAKEIKKQLEESEERRRKVLEKQRAKEEEKAQKGKKGNKKNKKDQKKKDNEEDGEEEKNSPEKGKKNEKKKPSERNSWRKEPGPCKTNLSISKAALKAKASARTEEMAEPHIHVSKACREDAFGVKKSALTATASERVAEMAKPTHPVDPVERPPPRERNAYGAPIFPKPKYGKRLPKVKPYKMGECKDKDEKNEDDNNKKGVKNRRRKYDSVPLFPSVDPCLDPSGANKQAKARKAAEEEAKARKKEKKQKQDQK